MADITSDEANSSSISRGDASRSRLPARNTLKIAAQPDPNAAVENIQTFPTTGFALPQTVKDADGIQALDFYRDGGGGVFNINQGSIEEFGNPYDYDDKRKRSSIRVYGKGKTGKQDKDLVPSYTKFILESQRESHTEKSQVIETFGDFYVFFFGERPSVYNFTGTLINTRSANWLQDFMFYYENYMRGTKCVEFNARLVLTYGGRQIEGFMLNCSTGTNATLEKGVQFSFDILVIDRKILNLSYDFGLTLSNGKFNGPSPFLSTLIQNGSALDVSKIYGFVKKVVNAEAKPAEPNPLTTNDLAASKVQFKGIDFQASPSGSLNASTGTA